MFTRISCYLSIIMLICLSSFLLAPVAVHADGGAPNRAYIAGATKGIGIIDLAKQKVVDHIAVAGDPHTILLSLDGRYLYVTEAKLKRLAIIIAGTGELLCTVPVPGHPTLLAMDPNANILFVASNDASIVTSIDPSNCSIKHIFQMNKPIYGLGIAVVSWSSLPSNSPNEVWVADSTELTVFDDVKGIQIKQIPIPSGPHYISIPPGSAVYVTTQQGSVITVDLSTYKVRTLISDGSYSSMDFDEGTSEVYVPDQKNDQLVILEPVYGDAVMPQEPLRTVPLQAKPVSVAVTSDGQLALVALEDGKVAVFDIPSHQITKTFDIGGSPHFIITGLNPPPLTATSSQQTQLALLSHSLQIVLIIIFVIVLLVVPLLMVARKRMMS